MPDVRGATEDEELYEDDWSALEVRAPPSRAVEHWHRARAGIQTTRILDSLLGDVREHQTAQLYEDDWSALAATEAAGDEIEANSSPSSPSRAMHNWARARARVRINKAMDGVLESVRAHQTEELYDQDWTSEAFEADDTVTPETTCEADAPTTPDGAAQPLLQYFEADAPMTPLGGAAPPLLQSLEADAPTTPGDAAPPLLQSLEADAPTPGDAAQPLLQPSEAYEPTTPDVASQVNEALAQTPPSQATPARAAPSRAREHWHKAQRAVGARMAMDNVLESVRGKQTEELYDQDWTASAVLKAAFGAEQAEVDEVEVSGERSQNCRLQSQCLEDVMSEPLGAQQDSSAAALATSAAA